MANGDEDKDLADKNRITSAIKLGALLQQQGCCDDEVIDLISMLNQPVEVYAFLEALFTEHHKTSPYLKRAFLGNIFFSKVIFDKYKNSDFKLYFSYLNKINELGFSEPQLSSIVYIFFYRPTFLNSLYEALRILKLQKEEDDDNIHLFMSACHRLLESPQFIDIDSSAEQELKAKRLEKEREDSDNIESDSVGREADPKFLLHVEINEKQEDNNFTKSEDPIYKMIHAIINLHNNGSLTKERLEKICQNPEASHVISYMVIKTMKKENLLAQDLESTLYRYLTNYQLFLQALDILLSALRKAPDLSEKKENFVKPRKNSSFTRLIRGKQSSSPPVQSDIEFTTPVYVKNIGEIISMMMEIAKIEGFKPYLEKFSLGVAILIEENRETGVLTQLRNYPQYSEIIARIYNYTKDHSERLIVESGIVAIMSNKGNKEEKLKKLLITQSYHWGINELEMHNCDSDQTKEILRTYLPEADIIVELVKTTKNRDYNTLEKEIRDYIQHYNGKRKALETLLHQKKISEQEKPDNKSDFGKPPGLGVSEQEDLKGKGNVSRPPGLGAKAASSSS